MTSGERQIIRMTKKNVAIIIAELRGGGAERIAGLLSKYLCNIYNIYLFTKEDSESVYDYGGTKIVLSKDGKSKVQILKEYKEKYHIDCAISFMDHSNLLNIQSKGKETVIFSVRTTLGQRVLAKRMDSSIRWMYPDADHIVAVSEGCKNDLIQNYGISSDAVTVIYNFLDKDMILKKAAQNEDEDVLIFKDKSKLVLHIGRLEKVKNQDRLLVQFSRLAKQEDVKLLIVGSGPEEAHLYEKINELGLIEKVKILPYQNNPFVYYKYADVFVLTSRVEGLPNVLLEAMALKTPVVSVDCISGPRELIAGEKEYGRKINGYEICKNGILVENAETDDTGKTDYLCQAIRKVLTDEELKKRIINNGFRFIKEYSNKNILNEWIYVIENTVAKDAGSRNRMIPALRDKNEVIVYGAGKYGKEVMLHLLEERSDWDFICFAVTDKSACQSPVRNIPMFELTELYEHRDRAMVVISVGQRYEDEVLNHIQKHGFQYTWGDV